MRSEAEMCSRLLAAMSGADQMTSGEVGDDAPASVEHLKNGKGEIPAPEERGKVAAMRRSDAQRIGNLLSQYAGEVATDAVDQTAGLKDESGGQVLAAREDGEPTIGESAEQDDRFLSASIFPTLFRK